MPRIGSEAELFALLSDSAGKSEDARPSVLLSWAQGVNGAIAAGPGERTAISCPESLDFVRRARGLHDAVLIGLSTLLADDPRLSSTRNDGSRTRVVVLDSSLRMPADAQLLSGADPGPLIVYAEDPCGRAGELEAAGATLVRVDRGRGGVDLRKALAALADAGVRSILVEGGAKVHASFLAEGLADRALVTIAALLFDGYPLLPEGALGRCLWRIGDAACAVSGVDLLLFGALEAAP